MFCAFYAFAIYWTDHRKAPISLDYSQNMRKVAWNAFLPSVLYLHDHDQERQPTKRSDAMSITIRNTNESYGDAIEFTAETEEAAVNDMQEAVRACFGDHIVVTDDDYEICE